MGFVKEFKEFAMRGNVVDMAVGIIIGAEFGKIVSSLVADVIMPPIGYLMNGVDFTDLSLKLGEATKVGEDGKEIEVEQVLIKYGNFIQAVINFVIVAFAIFMMIKVMNSLKKEEEEAPEAPPEPSKEEKLLAEIRDAIKANN